LLIDSSPILTNLFDLYLQLLRRSKCEHSHSQLSEADYDEGEEMVCKMKGGEEADWNLWESITFESVGRSLTPIVREDSEGVFVNKALEMEKDNARSSSNGRGDDLGPKLSFHPIARPPSRPQSRIRTGSAFRRSRTDDHGKYTISDSFSLPNPNSMTPPRRVRSLQLRPESPAPRASRPDRNVQAAACFQALPVFAIDSNDSDSLQDELQPFHTSLSDFISVERDFVTSKNYGLGVICIKTRKSGFLEITPHTKLSRDMISAFLQASLKEGVIYNKVLGEDLVRQRQLVLTPSDVSFDMQHFEAHAVNNRFENESSWEKIRRKSASFAERFQECESLHFDPFIFLNNFYPSTLNLFTC